MSTLDEVTVARLLLRHWDVLSVADNDVEAESEYRNEGAAVLALLRIGSDREAITEHLRRVAESLHASPDAARDRRAAESICAAYRE